MQLFMSGSRNCNIWFYFSSQAIGHISGGNDDHLSRPHESQTSHLCSNIHEKVKNMVINFLWLLSLGHINPAVTLGVLVSGQMSLIRGVLYMVAQFVGGIVGAALLKVSRDRCMLN